MFSQKISHFVFCEIQIKHFSYLEVWAVSSFDLPLTDEKLHKVSGCITVGILLACGVTHTNIIIPRYPHLAQEALTMLRTCNSYSYFMKAKG